MLVQQEKPTMVVVQVLKHGLPKHRTDTRSPFNRGSRGLFYLLQDSQQDLYIARHRKDTDGLQLQEDDVIPGVIVHRSDLLRFAPPREWNLHWYRRTAFANACRHDTSTSFFQCSFPSISSTAEVLYVHEVSTPAGKQRVLVCTELDGTETAVACNKDLLRVLQSPKYSQQPRILMQFKNTCHEVVQLDIRGRGTFAVQRPLRLFKPYGVRPALRAHQSIDPDHRQQMYATAYVFYNNRAWLYLSRNKARSALALSDLHECALLPLKYSKRAIRSYSSRSRPVTVRPCTQQSYQFLPHYQDARVMVRSRVWWIDSSDAGPHPLNDPVYKARSGDSNDRNASPPASSAIRHVMSPRTSFGDDPMGPGNDSWDGNENQERILRNAPAQGSRFTFRPSRASGLPSAAPSPRSYRVPGQPPFYAPAPAPAPFPQSIPPYPSHHRYPYPYYESTPSYHLGWPSHAYGYFPPFYNPAFGQGFFPPRQPATHAPTAHPSYANFASHTHRPPQPNGPFKATASAANPRQSKQAYVSTEGEEPTGAAISVGSSACRSMSDFEVHLLLCDPRGHFSVAVLPLKLFNVNLDGRYVSVCRHHRSRRLELRNTSDRLLQQLELRGRGLRVVEIVNAHLLVDPPRQKPVSANLLHLVLSANAMYAICDHGGATVAINVEASNISWMAGNSSFLDNGRIAISALPRGRQVRLGTERIDLYDRLIIGAPWITKFPAFVTSTPASHSVTFRLGPVVKSLYRNGTFHCLCPTECSRQRPHVHNQDDRYAVVDVMQCLPKIFGFRRGHDIQLRLVEMGFLFIESPLNSSTHQPHRFYRARLWAPLPDFERTNSTATRGGLSERARGKQPINTHRRSSRTISAASQDAGLSSRQDPSVNAAMAQNTPAQSTAPEAEAAEAGPSAYPDIGARSATARRERNVTWEESAGGSSSSDDLYVPINRPRPYSNPVQEHRSSRTRQPTQDRRRPDDRSSRPRLHRTGVPGARHFQNRQQNTQNPLYASYPDYPPQQLAAHFDHHRQYQQQMPPDQQQIPPYQQHMPPYQQYVPPYQQTPEYPQYPPYAPYSAQNAPCCNICCNPQPSYAQQCPTYSYGYPAGVPQAGSQNYRPAGAAGRVPEPMRAQTSQQAPETAAESSSPRTTKTSQIDGRTVHHASYETAEESSGGGAPIRETKKKKQGKQPQR